MGSPMVQSHLTLNDLESQDHPDFAALYLLEEPR